MVQSRKSSKPSKARRSTPSTKVEPVWFNDGAGYKTLHCSGEGVVVTMTIRASTTFETVQGVLAAVEEKMRP